VALRIYNLTIDAHDQRSLARFWSEASGYRVAFDNPDEVAIERANDPGRHRPGDQDCVVMADPEGNEFCVLPPR